MSSETRKTARIGNQNARKHGYYSKVRTQKEHYLLSLVDSAEDIDRDIVLLKVKICSIVEKDPDNGQLLVYAVSLLHRMERTRDILVARRRKEFRRTLKSLGQTLDIKSKTSHARSSPS